MEPRTHLQSDPYLFFEQWMRDAVNAGEVQPDAMSLSTCTRDGVPSARMVLFKGLKNGRFYFYTNYESRKAQEIDANPRAALIFYWSRLDRQIRIEGVVARATREDSEEYFKTRPRLSQLGAWASRQSSVIPDENFFYEKLESMKSKFEGSEIICPPFWGGYAVDPQVIEFWIGNKNRLHDRIRYTHTKSQWVIERLSP